MSGGGSSGGTTTTVQKSDPWAGQQPYLQGGPGIPGVMPEAARLYQQNPLQFYPGQTFAPLSSETETALQAQTNRALTGSPVTGAMNTELQKTLSGGYLDAASNPYLMPMAENIRAQVQPAIDARFAAGGRGQSGLGARAVSQGVTDALATQAYNNYNNERTNQMRAMMFAPQAAMNDYQDIAKLQEVGNVREDLQQQQINEAMQRFQFDNMEPYQRLGLYNQLVQGNYGGQTTGSQTLPRRSVGTNVLGGGLAGGGLGYLASNSLGFSSPWTGAAYGAGGGALLGGLLM